MSDFYFTLAYSFVASCLGIFIPYVIGRSILPENISYKTFYSWFFGFLIIIELFMLVEITYSKVLIKNLGLMLLMLAGLSGIKLLVKYLISYKCKFDYIQKRIYKNIYHRAIIILVGLLPSLIASVYMPYPLFGLSHAIPKSILLPIYRISEDGIPLFNIRYGEVLLVYIASIPFDYDPMKASYILRFLLTVLLAEFSFELFLTLFRSRTLAFLSMIVALFSNHGFYYHPYNMLFFDVPAQHFRGNMVIFALFPLLIYLMIKEGSRLSFKEKFFKVVFPMSILCAAFSLFALFPYEFIYKSGQYYKHIFIDPFVYVTIVPSLFIFLYLRFLYNPNIFNELLLKFYTILFSLHFLHREETILFFPLCLLIFLFTNSKIWKHLRMFALTLPIYLFLLLIINPRNSSLTLLTKSSWDFEELFKFYEFFYGNGSITIIMFIFALFVLLYRILKLDKPLINFEETLYILHFVTLFAYFFPISWTYRLFKAMTICMGLAIGQMLLPIARRRIIILFSLGKNRKLKLLKMKELIILILTIILIIDGSYSVNRRFSYLYPGMEYQSALYPYEYEVAFWLKRNLPKNTILVSDYFSIWTLVPLSNKIWPIEEYMLFQEVPEHLKGNVYIIKDGILKAENASLVYKNIEFLIRNLPIQEKIYIKMLGSKNISVAIVVTPRTIAWIRSNVYDPFIYCPPGYVDPSIPELEKFRDNRYFRLAFNSSNVLVYVTTSDFVAHCEPPDVVDRLRFGFEPGREAGGGQRDHKVLPARAQAP